MNELKKPLGQKPDKDNTNKKNSGSTASLGVIAALCVATSALGFVIYDRIFPSKTNNPPKTEITFETKEKPVLRDSNTLAANETRPEPKPVERLRELEADGELTTPRVTPTPSPRIIGQKKGASHLPEKDLSEKTANGVLPKISNDGRRPMDVYAREPDTQGNFGVARVVIIVASLGISQSSSQQAIKQLPDSVTLAFAPYGNSLKRWMQLARKEGHELLLQLPMEPFGQANPGPHTLTTQASPTENLKNLHWSMARISNYVGVMNYLGGKLTANPTALKPIFDDISERGLLYIDDGSAGKSKAKIAATQSLLPFAKAHVQLDNIRSKNEIAKRLNELTLRAKRTGLAIGVANAFPETIKMIADYANKADQLEIEITPVSAIVKDPKRNN